MKRPSEHARDYLAGLKKVLDQLPFESLDRIVQLIEAAHAAGKQIFIIGNGGSAATASHMMCDLNKGTIGYKGDATWKRFRVIALTDNIPLMSAWANDTDYNHIFAEPLKNLAQPGDLLLAISASGNSPNIVAAVEVAKKLGLKVAGLAGFTGGKLEQMSDACFTVPSSEYGPVEDVHMILDHIVTSYLYEKLKATHAKS
jgi:D-sedoheptulose 7-phosphate isomerase